MKHLFCILFLVGFSSFGQLKTLVVLDSISKEAIPFVNVEYTGLNSGGFTDDFGSIDIREQIKEIKVSCLGYVDKSYVLEKIKDTILLNPKFYELDEAVLYNFKNVTVVNEESSKLMLNFKTNSQGFIFLRNFNDLIDNVILEINGDIENDEHEKTLLLGIFEIDDNNMPTKNILIRNQSLTLKPLQKGFSFDLNGGNVKLDKNSYLVSITIISNSDTADSNVKMGLTLDNKELSSYKAYFKNSPNSFKLPKARQNKYYNFNFSLKVAKIQ